MMRCAGLPDIWMFHIPFPSGGKSSLGHMGSVVFEEGAGRI